MSEAAVLQAIRLDVGGLPDMRLFRNNCGVLLDQRGRPVQFGLHPGSGDLIGWRSVVIGPEHIGRRLAIFASIEVKHTGRPSPEQLHWARVVSECGGLAGIARNTGQARTILGLPE